jgi:DNA-binding CsgD family transcriptional regulator
VRHLVMAFYLLAMAAGSASLAQTLMVWQRQRKPVIRAYGWFLLSLFLILVGFLVDSYASLAMPGGGEAARIAAWIAQAAGGILFIVTSPFFYHRLVDLPVGRARRVAFFALDALVGLAAVSALAFPHWVPAFVFLAAVLFGMIVYGLVFIALRLGRVGDRMLRRALVIFLALTAVFFPLMLIDAAMGFVPWLGLFRFMDNLTQPLYFLVLNCLTVAFGLKYLNRPAYAERDVLTDHFVAAFGISPREKEMIGLLLTGMGTKEAAAKLFISAKTADNHAASIYRKLGVSSRVQMFQLIRTNSIE